ncbi:MAG: MMPL family transporter [bacterium]
MLERLAIFLIKKRVAVIAAMAAITLVFMHFMYQLKINDNFEESVYRGDLGYEDLSRTMDKLGHDDMVLVAVECGDVLEPKNLELIRALHSKLEALPSVGRVVSLANAQDLVMADGELSYQKVTSPGGRSQERIAADIQANPVYGSLLISDDLKAAALYLQLAPEVSSDTVIGKQVVGDVVRVMEGFSTETGMRTHVVGPPVLRAAWTDRVTRDLCVFVPLAMLLVVGALFAIFRSFFLTILPFVVIGIPVIWTMGLVQIFSGELNLVTIIVPTVLLVIGTSDLVHMLSNYRESMVCCGSRLEAIVRMVKLSALPCFMTSFTTMLGFFSMLVNEIAPIREMGIYAGVGLGLSYLVAITLAPAVLSFLGPVHLGDFLERQVLLGRRLDGVLEWAWRQAVTPGSWGVRAAVVVAAFCCSGFLAVDFSTDLTSMLPSSELNASHEYVNRHFAGTGVMYVHVKAENGVSILAPANLEIIDRLRKHLEEDAGRGVGKVTAVTDVLKYVRMRWMGEEQQGALPSTEAEAAQLVELASMAGDGSLFENYVYLDRDKNESFVTISMKGHDFDVWERVIQSVNGFIGAHATDGLTMQLTGVNFLRTRFHEPMVRGLKTSSLLALVTITLSMALVFRSFKAGVVAMLPNVLPVVMTLGVMGLLDIRMNMFTAPFASIALGLAVDDTLQFFGRYSIERRSSGSPEEALHRTMLAVGKAMIFTSIIFVLGFGIDLFSSFEVTRNFGALVAFALVAAMLADLLLTPRLILRTRVLEKRAVSGEPP